MDPTIIKVDPEITLKQFQVEDSEVFLQVVNANRFHLRRWLGWVDNVTSVEGAKNFIEGFLEGYRTTGNFELGIWYKEQLVGGVGIHDLKKISKKCALGYWLSEEFTGEGIMTRSVKALINYLFSSMKLHRIEIEAGVLNGRSNGIPKRLGFKFEGVARDAEWLYDHYHNLNLYAILDYEW